jgi:hypothetical protein
LEHCQQEQKKSTTKMRVPRMPACWRPAVAAIRPTAQLLAPSTGAFTPAQNNNNS